MRRSLSLLAIAVGSGLLVASALAGPAARRENVLRVSLIGADFEYTDPALAYSQPAWTVVYATCLNLVNYPDAPVSKGLRVVPEASLAPLVSRNGRRYTFRIRRGLRFNTGEPVTPESFAKALYRVLSPKINSPGAPLVSDIVGAKAVIANRAQRAPGIRVSGRSLILDLGRPVPDFLQRIAIPFFCATARSVRTVEGGVDVFPSAGPYYIASRTRNKSLVLRRNPYYRGHRPRALASIIYVVQQAPDKAVRDVEAQRADWAVGHLPPNAYARLYRRFGLNKSRFWVKPTMVLAFLAFNTSRPPFSDPRVRRAVNYALDRRAIVRAFDPFSRTATDDYLPPQLRGGADPHVYPLSPTPDALRKARQLSRGRIGDGRVWLKPNTSDARARLIREQLARIGFDVELRGSACLECPADFELSLWALEYPDAGRFLEGAIRQSNYRLRPDIVSIRKIRRISHLRGSERTRAYRRLAVELARHDAPLASLYVLNDRDFFSARVGCVTYQPVYGIDLAALCLR